MAKKNTQGKKKGGMRKRGRMIAWCQAYRNRGQREKNKKAKLLKHITLHPNDHVAKEAINKVKAR